MPVLESLFKEAVVQRCSVKRVFLKILQFCKIHRKAPAPELSRRLQDVLQRSLQDVFKTCHQVKLFLLTSFQNDFETYSKHF